MKDNTYRWIKLLLIAVFIAGSLIIGWLHAYNGRFELVECRIYSNGELHKKYYRIVDKWGISKKDDGCIILWNDTLYFEKYRK
jgi:hypothetical protein